EQDGRPRADLAAELRLRALGADGLGIGLDRFEGFEFVAALVANVIVGGHTRWTSVFRPGVRPGHDGERRLPSCSLDHWDSAAPVRGRDPSGWTETATLVGRRTRSWIR